MIRVVSWASLGFGPNFEKYFVPKIWRLGINVLLFSVSGSYSNLGSQMRTRIVPKLMSLRWWVVYTFVVFFRAVTIVSYADFKFYLKEVNTKTNLLT